MLLSAARKPLSPIFGSPPVEYTYTSVPPTHNVHINNTPHRATCKIQGVQVAYSIESYTPISMPQTLSTITSLLTTVIGCQYIQIICCMVMWGVVALSDQRRVCGQALKWKQAATPTSYARNVKRRGGGLMAI